MVVFDLRLSGKQTNARSTTYCLSQKQVVGLRLPELLLIAIAKVLETTKGLEGNAILVVELAFHVRKPVGVGRKVVWAGREGSGGRSGCVCVAGEVEGGLLWRNLGELVTFVVVQELLHDVCSGLVLFLGTQVQRLGDGERRWEARERGWGSRRDGGFRQSVADGNRKDAGGDGSDGQNDAAPTLHLLRLEPRLAVWVGKYHTNAG